MITWILLSLQHPFQIRLSFLVTSLSPLAKASEGKTASKKMLDVSKVKQHSKRQAFICDICTRLDSIQLSSENPEENGTFFRNAIESSAMNVLRPTSRKYQDWFDENDDDETPG